MTCVCRAILRPSDSPSSPNRGVLEVYFYPFEIGVEIDAKYPFITPFQIEVYYTSLNRSLLEVYFYPFEVGVKIDAKYPFITPLWIEVY